MELSKQQRQTKGLNVLFLLRQAGLESEISGLSIVKYSEGVTKYQICNSNGIPAKGGIDLQGRTVRLDALPIKIQFPLYRHET